MPSGASWWMAFREGDWETSGGHRLAVSVLYPGEKKDEVIGKAVKSEDIPAATQLFTLNWIVQYLVQNSVGRYWLQTYPDSALPAVMPYFVFPGEQPIEVLDRYARLTLPVMNLSQSKCSIPPVALAIFWWKPYNLLYRIYEERGYRSRDIPNAYPEPQPLWPRY